MKNLDKIKGCLTNDYTRGRINREQYDLLTEEISINYREVFSKEIDSSSMLPKNDKTGKLSLIQDNIEDAYAKRKINQSQYTLLRERLSKYEKSQT